MKVIWVLENIQEDVKFYGRLNILLLLASVSLWKRNHPKYPCIFYGDRMTIDLLKELKVAHLWDELIEYVHDRKIDRKVFWACNKVNVLSKQTEPCIILDHDTLVFKSIEEYLNNEVLVANLETGKGYYPDNLDKYVKKLSYRKRWNSEALNVSFLYFPDPQVIENYTERSLKMMEEFSSMKVPNSQYLIFAEQLILRDLLDSDKIPYKSIVSNYWDCTKWDWGKQHDKGLFQYPESDMIFKHYGPLKSYIEADKTELGYEEECKLLYNCINIRNLDLSTIVKK